MALLADYSTRPGEIGAAPEQIAPASDGSPARSRLLMFVHPRCPCSTASVAELARIMARSTDRVDATVYLFRPASEADAWTQGANREVATSIPGVRVMVDPDGKIAESFGSNTSGDVLVYDAGGRLRFHGGITAARGHEGDSLGKSAALAAILGDPVPTVDTPVFGCVLRPRPAPAAE